MNAWFQVVLPLCIVVLLAKPLGWLMAGVMDGRTGSAPLGMGFALGWLERAFYRAAGVRTAEGRPSEMDWKRYALGLVVFNLMGAALVYALLRVQHLLPLNPAELGPVDPWLALNTAVSFATNTNWQSYGGETTLSYLSQMLGLGVQNFLSAATGIAAVTALARGLRSQGGRTVGNCWADLTRATLYILLPLSVVLAIALVSQGVVQTFAAPVEASGQLLPLGPAASQVAIKQLGTNGGGFFNVNSAHPFENPTPLSDLLQVVAILLIPAALCWTLGDLVRDRRQGWAILAAMVVILAPLLAATQVVESQPNPALQQAIADSAAHPVALEGGNMEGKEARFGVAGSVRWAVATTAASNGSVNSMHDSYLPLGGLLPMWLMQLGEVVFGGVGSGLYGMLMFVVLAVFVAGLMVGRAPEYLGKKIDPFEMKMACLAILAPCALVLLGTALAVLTPAAWTTSNPGPHAFSQILYAFSSAANNNGSAFAGLSAGGPFYCIALSVAMWLGRFMVLVPVLAVAGTMAGKRSSPPTSGTLPTHTPVFIGMLVAVVVVVGALTFVPALALGPIAEHLQLVTRSAPGTP